MQNASFFGHVVENKFATIFTYKTKCISIILEVFSVHALFYNFEIDLNANWFNPMFIFVIVQSIVNFHVMNFIHDIHVMCHKNK